ncbi:sigma-54 dependent transcriptional regulator [candidate division NPL-UPA2 bacterium]|nr:sigma-54 dependent transcriptional regulator [candidate division NPL-UPA2 bacterium]
MKKGMTVLVVDDVKDDLESIVQALELDGYRVIGTRKGATALDIIQDEEVSVVITDLKMPGIDGMELLEAAREKRPETAVIMITGYGDISSAVNAMKAGAYDYLTKPINMDELEQLIEKARERQNLSIENIQLRQLLNKKYGFENLIGKTREMEAIYDKIAQIAPTKSTVLICGESGTGKELIAKAIHQNSPRRNKPFIALDCSALSEGVIESELFGHEKGAFTGAIGRRIGRIEAAQGGTLFIDEIGEVTTAIQLKLLRVLEERELVRVGGSETIKLNVRLIAATNKDLKKAVQDKSFREDLYYRLNVATINVPPLRQRKEDIPLLVSKFIAEFSKEHNRRVKTISREAIDKLMDYSWPGNVRELRNLIEGVIITLKRQEISMEDLPPHIRGLKPAENYLALKLGSSLDKVIKETIRKTLTYFQGNRTRAARSLGISRKTLIRKIKEYHLK